MTATEIPTATNELRSTLTDDGMVRFHRRTVDIRQPGPGEVLVKVGASPINPSDLGMMFGGASPDSFRAADGDDGPGVAGDITAGLGAMTARFGKPMPCGNEGGGTVVASGGGDEADALVGNVVGFTSGDAYAEYCTVQAAACLAMPDGVTPEQAAAPFVNPMTALGMVETMKMDGHQALVHTVGASNLGQMLIKICAADGVGLVNLVRRPEQAALCRSLGAEHVVDTSAESFPSDLADALRETGATVAFDAIGGGETAGTLLATMESVASAGAEYSRYGSGQETKVYIYGRLDSTPIVINQRMGFGWSVGGWLLPPFLAKAGPEIVGRMRERVADEITTTFASEYGMRLSLDEAVDVEHAKRYARIATGDKALVVP